MLYVGSNPVPGARDALETLQAAGWQLVFVTNNSTKERWVAAQTIERRIGFHTHPENVLTSAYATARYLKGHVGTAYVVGAPGLAATLEHEGIAVASKGDGVDAVVVGLDPGLTYEKLIEASLAIRSGARFVATNTDATYPSPRGLYPGGGAIVAALQRSTDVEPEVCGKPHEPMRSLVRDRAGPGPVVVVGDRPETDLALAGAEGWKKVLVMTGVTEDAETVPAAFQPHAVLDSIADLPAMIDELVDST